MEEEPRDDVVDASLYDDMPLHFPIDRSNVIICSTSNQIFHQSFPRRLVPSFNHVIRRFSSRWTVRRHGGGGHVDTTFDSHTSTTLSSADSARDIPRGTRDTGMTGEMGTGTGDTLPARATEHKNLAGGGNEPLAKGESHYAKHAKQKEGDLDK